MNEDLTRVLNAGFEACFSLAHASPADGSPVYECRLSAPGAGKTAAWGETPAEALTAVSPLAGQ